MYLYTLCTIGNENVAPQRIQYIDNLEQIILIALFLKGKGIKGGTIDRRLIGDGKDSINNKGWVLPNTLEYLIEIPQDMNKAVFTPKYCEI